MGYPKKVIPTINLKPEKILLQRREELLSYITEDGTFLPKQLLHPELDRGFLDFVKEDLKTVVSGKIIPMIDLIITTQNWAQFTETWDVQDLNGNPTLPFITVVRQPEVKYGSNPALLWNIPNRKEFYYAAVPTWNGNIKGMDIYKIPQPVPVDITYNVKIVCNRMRELNSFNKNVLEMFASRQAYTVIKGHYIPIVMGNISDESVVDLEKRKYYVQSYEFTLLGFLIDEDEFEVSPAVSRILQVIELESQGTRKRQKKLLTSESATLDVLFVVGNNIITQIFDYTVDLNLVETNNVESFEVFINNDYYGMDIEQIQLNTNDTLRLIVTKNDIDKDSIIKFSDILV